MSAADNPFRRCLESGHFALTAELVPPRGAELDSLTAAAKALKPAVTAINLTDGAGARSHLSSLAAAIRVRQLGIEPVLQVTCRDRNRIAIRSDLLGAAAFGVNNVLVLAGDSLDRSDAPEATPVFDFDTRSLLTAIGEMNGDGAAAGDAVPTARPALYCGAADTPVDPVREWTPASLLAKSEAGARFVQTQFCFDMALFGRYMAALEEHGITEKLYVLAGLGPLRSAAGARWIRDNLPGSIIPDGIVRRMEAARDPHREGIEICAELIAEAREIPGVAGVHLMAPGHPQSIVESIRLAGTL